MALSLDNRLENGKTTFSANNDVPSSPFPKSTAPASTKLCSWNDLPSWQRDNEFICSGYRKASASWSASVASIFSLHNETVNIHSHLLGGLLFCLLPSYAYCTVYARRDDMSRLADLVVFSVFFLGVASCFLLSACYHIFANHSPRVAAIGNQLDYLGVIILMWGATIPTVFYGFHDSPRLQHCYWATISTLAGLCGIATLHPKFRTSAFRPHRATMYAALGLSVVVSIIHGVIIHGWKEQSRRMSLYWMLFMALLNLVGASLYAMRVPEKLRPGRFDIFGSSHQVMHVMVILAGLVHMVGLVQAFRYVREVK